MLGAGEGRLKQQTFVGAERVENLISNGSTRASIRALCSSAGHPPPPPPARALTDSRPLSVIFVSHFAGCSSPVRVTQSVTSIPRLQPHALQSIALTWIYCSPTTNLAVTRAFFGGKVPGENTQFFLQGVVAKIMVRCKWNHKSCITAVQQEQLWPL